MNQPRHFHNLTILPNGNVLAIGGNTFGNGAPGDHPNNPCEASGQRIDEIDCLDGCPSLCMDYGGYFAAFSSENCGLLESRFGCSMIERVPCIDDADCDDILPGATCNLANGNCTKVCVTDADCGTLGTNACAPGVLASPYDNFAGKCHVANNKCHAAQTAEVYNPSDDTWTEFGAQEFPRMYHSSALLMPDGRVLSMGGGHTSGVNEYPISEYFSPQYAPDRNAPRPQVSFLVNNPTLDYSGSVNVSVTGADPVRFTLIRLGATTHGFDQDQRLIELDFSLLNNRNYSVVGPSDSAVAPEGYYLLFALASTGQPSVGQYLKVGN